MYQIRYISYIRGVRVVLGIRGWGLLHNLDGIGVVPAKGPRERFRVVDLNDPVHLDGGRCTHLPETEMKK